MTVSKVWYIPGWAAPRSGDCKLVRELSKVVRVEVVWLPEYGNASESADEIYAPTLAERLRREPSPVALMGWSLGGMVAMELAAMAPEKVEKLVLISTTARFCSDQSRPFGPTVDRVREMQDSIGPDTIRRFILTCYQPARPSKEELDARVTGALEADDDQLRLGLTYLIKADHRPILPGLRMPTLIAHGDGDFVVPRQAADELARKVQTNLLYQLAGAGHMITDTHGCLLEDRISGFLKLN